MKNVFESQDCNELIGRLEKLSEGSKAQWGKMNAGQMLAHCNVAYEYTFDPVHSKPKGFQKWILKKFVKPIVVGPKPYKKNNRTAPQFLISDSRDFNKERARLINYIQKTQELGESYFDNKESHSFGVLSKQEWNTMFAKHLEHHLEQFGV